MEIIVHYPDDYSGTLRATLLDSITYISFIL